MAKLYFIALAINSLLPALCTGAFCPDGQLDETQIKDYVLDQVNEKRKLLLDGNQKNGNSGDNLPPPKGMTQLNWNCDLEKEARDIIAGGCYDYIDEPPVTNDKARVYMTAYADGLPNGPQLVRELLAQSLAEINSHALEGVTAGATEITYKPGAVEYLLNYFTLMRPSNTEIGCHWKICTKDGDEMVNVLCVMNSQQLKDGDVIYNVGTAGTCTDCPAGTSCDPTSKLCAPTSTTTTPSPATSTTTPTTTTTTPPPAVTTTPPTSSEASFPTGASSRCTHAVASRMTDTLRSEYERLHNFRRGLLAKGEVPRKDGKYLPTASNMQKITYDCGLEEGAIRWASQCPTTNSEPSSRNGVGENFKTIPATRFTFDSAAKKSVTEWWKPIRDVNYFEKVVVFRPFHDGAPISSFTQMGWATSNLLGCSIVKCTTSNRYVGVCRYSPKGNLVNNNVYQVGTVCSACPTGKTSCNRDEGLCY